MKATAVSTAICVVLACSLAGLVGCGGGGVEPPVEPESARVSVRVVLEPPASAAMVPSSVAEIDEIVLTVSAESGDFETFTVALTWNPDTYTATGEVRVRIGQARRLLVEARRADGLVLYRGEQTVDVTGNTPVEISLEPPGVPIEVVCPIHEFDGPPRIVIESVPPYGESGYAEGSVANVIPWECAVAVYIKVGGSWWTKPYWNSPLTAIDGEGRWLCNIVTGGIDYTATEIRAYLVRAGYSPPTAPSVGLPPDPPTPDVLALASVTRTPTEE